MARVVITELADVDSGHILADLADKAGARVADSYNADFDSLYQRLAAFPESGSLRPRLGASVRIGVVPPYIVIYRYGSNDDLVAILRIVHGRRRITRRLLTTTAAPP